LIKFKVITPGPFHPQPILDGFYKAGEETIDEAEGEFLDTVEWWHNPVTFEKEFKTTSSGWVGKVKTNNLIYFFLAHGTSVRYATMTSDFISKTLPNWMASRAGRGGLAFIDRNQPRPGIEARNWDKVEAKKQQPLLLKRAKKNLEAGVKKCGHAF
jgi:hypothetical protein